MLISLYSWMERNHFENHSNASRNGREGGLCVLLIMLMLNNPTRRGTLPAMVLACVKERVEAREPQPATEVVAGAKKGGAKGHTQRNRRKIATSPWMTRYPKRRLRQRAKANLPVAAAAATPRTQARRSLIDTIACRGRDGTGSRLLLSALRLTHVSGPIRMSQWPDRREQPAFANSIYGTHVRPQPTCSPRNWS